MNWARITVLAGLCCLVWSAGSLAAGDHSYANPEQVLVRHLELDLTVDFKRQQLVGAVVLDLELQQPQVDTLVLDTRDLQISAVELGNGTDWVDTDYKLDQPEPMRGAALRISLKPDTRQVRVSYATSPTSTGLQWLQARQTADGKHPYMYSQAQAIHARSFVPLQDSPAVRVTYGATIHTPKALRAVMSAGNDPQAPLDGEHRFEMPQAIPSYLIALAVGDLDFEPMGERTGVYAEASVLAAAAAEFSDTQAMLEQVETMYGDYQWGRYDLLILPPSFPWGGMENPRLSFITPTVIAGDKSLVGLIAHELAHSWSGNTVTNASWEDVWLNEGFTTYLTYRIIEAVYGPQRADMERLLGYQSLQRNLADLPPADQRLQPDLTGRDPDDGFTEIPYEKGALLVTELERAVGRVEFDKFLTQYFSYFAFRSISTEQFLEFLDETLIAEYPSRISRQRLYEWLQKPGLPAGAPVPVSAVFDRIDEVRAAWLVGEVTTADLPTAAWTVFEWLHFLNGMPAQVSLPQLTALDASFGLTASSNSEIAHSWFLLAIRNSYEPAYPALREYLVRVGRRKLIVPLYRALLQSPEGRLMALEIFAQARPGYQSVAVATVDALFQQAE